jgi:predicted phosphodiesterase
MALSRRRTNTMAPRQARAAAKPASKPSSSSREQREQALLQAVADGAKLKPADRASGFSDDEASRIISTATGAKKIPPRRAKSKSVEQEPVAAPTITKPENKSTRRAAGTHDEYPDLYPEGFEECASNIELQPVSSDTVRVLAIGDAHDHPGIKDKRRFAAVGRLAARERYDWLMCIGDSTDMNSLCHHVRNDTWSARMKPTFDQDMDSLAEAWLAIHDEMPKSYQPRRHITLGNHENWAVKYEDDHPEVQGTLVGRLITVYESHGWSWSPFGQTATIAGVDFTHAPLGIMGRPYGGKNVEQTVANEVLRDLCFGHTHRFNDILRPKLGARRGVRVVNVGSAMPPGYVAEHAKYTPNFMSYGLTELTIKNGHLICVRFLPFETLYADLGLGDLRKAA